MGEGGLLTISGLKMLDSSCSVIGPLKDLESCIPMDWGGGGINPNRVLTMSGLSMLDSSCSVMGPLKDLDSCMPMDWMDMDLTISWFRKLRLFSNISCFTCNLRISFLVRPRIAKPFCKIKVQQWAKFDSSFDV